MSAVRAPVRRGGPGLQRCDPDDRVLAKLDGTARGGAVIGVESDLGVPMKPAGVGEGIDDDVPFDPAAYLRSLVDG